MFHISYFLFDQTGDGTKQSQYSDVNHESNNASDDISGT